MVDPSQSLKPTMPESKFEVYSVSSSMDRISAKSSQHANSPLWNHPGAEISEWHRAFLPANHENVVSATFVAFRADNLR